jgi:hypothetical protein
VYVERHTSPESFAESRFCLSRPFLFFGAVHEPLSSQLSWTQKEIAMLAPQQEKKIFSTVLIALITVSIVGLLLNVGF